MKRFLSLSLVALFALSLLTACSSAPGTSPTADQSIAPAGSASDSTGAQASTGASEELMVFAAASMTESMNEIAAKYKALHPEVTIKYNFDSSGTLKTQIQEGADCDIFISAGKKQVDELDKSADATVNTEELDMILANSRFNLVGNQVVLIVPANSKADITDFKDVDTDKVKLIALGNSDVPAGQYAEEVYTSLGLWDKLKASKKVTYGSNVKEVLEQVKAGSVDCGVVYSTDAATESGVKVAQIAPKDSHKAIVYPAAIIKESKHQAAAQAFMDYLKGSECAQVFESIGFTIPSR